MKETKSKEFLKSKLVRKIAPDVFEIRVNLETREAGVEVFEISRKMVTVRCTEYTIEVPNDRDFDIIVEAIEYELLDVEGNTEIIRQVLGYLYSIRVLIDSILDYFNQDLAKKND